MRFVFIQISLTWVKEKNVNVPILCGLLLYDSVLILTKFKISLCNYVRLKGRPCWESKRGNTSGSLAWDPLGCVLIV